MTKDFKDIYSKMENINNNYNDNYNYSKALFNPQLMTIKNESDFNSAKEALIELIKNGTKLHSATILTENGEELTSRGIVVKSENNQPNLTIIQKAFGCCIDTPEGIFLPINIKEKDTLEKILSKTQVAIEKIEKATDVRDRSIFGETFDDLSNNPMMLAVLGGVITGKIIAKTGSQLTNMASKGVGAVVGKIKEIRKNIADKKDGDEFEIAIEKLKNYSFSEYQNPTQNNQQKLKIRT